MAISRAPVFKRCNALGIDPIILGYTHKPSIRRKRVNRRKKSEYANQLKEKQKVRFIYGVREKQFKLIYAKAERMQGVTGENLLQLLELRFDNTLFRLGLATTRIQARQLINHGHIRLNGKRVDIPSVTLKVGDKITITDSMQQALKMKRLSQNRTIPSWLHFDDTYLVATVLSKPQRSDIDYDVTESSIVELYSK